MAHVNNIKNTIKIDTDTILDNGSKLEVTEENGEYTINKFTIHGQVEIPQTFNTTELAENYVGDYMKPVVQITCSYTVDAGEILVEPSDENPNPEPPNAKVLDSGELGEEDNLNMDGGTF